VIGYGIYPALPKKSHRRGAKTEQAKKTEVLVFVDTHKVYLESVPKPKASQKLGCSWKTFEVELIQERWLLSVVLG
jgi:hypothetical protein